MRVNLMRLIQEHGIAATRHDGQTTDTANAQVVLPGPATLAACELPPDSDTAGVDMEPGMALVVWKREGAQPGVNVIDPTEPLPADEGEEQARDPNLFTLRSSDVVEGNILRAGDDEIPLLAEGGSNARIMERLHAWLHSARARDSLEADKRTQLTQNLFEFVNAVVERTGDRSFARTACTMQILHAYGDVAMPEGMDRYLESKAIRAEITRIDPGHPDALSNPAPVTELLRRHGIERTAQSGISVRPAGGRVVNDETLGQMFRANQKLCEDVFHPLTTLPIEDISVGLLTLEEYETLAGSLAAADGELSGEWVQQACAKMTEVVEAGVGANYRFESSFWTSEGRDVLLISEPEMPLHDGTGMAYYYSWPNDTRKPVMDWEQRVSGVSPEDIPSTEEVARLRTALYEITPEEELEPADDDDPYP